MILIYFEDTLVKFCVIYHHLKKQRQRKVWSSIGLRDYGSESLIWQKLIFISLEFDRTNKLTNDQRHPVLTIPQSTFYTILLSCWYDDSIARTHRKREFPDPVRCIFSHYFRGSVTRPLKTNQRTRLYIRATLHVIYLYQFSHESD